MSFALQKSMHAHCFGIMTGYFYPAQNNSTALSFIKSGTIWGRNFIWMLPHRNWVGYAQNLRFPCPTPSKWLLVMMETALPVRWSSETGQIPNSQSPLLLNSPAKTATNPVDCWISQPLAGTFAPNFFSSSIINATTEPIVYVFRLFFESHNLFRLHTKTRNYPLLIFTAYAKRSQFTPYLRKLWFSSHLFRLVSVCFDEFRFV